MSEPLRTFEKVVLDDGMTEGRARSILAQRVENARLKFGSDAGRRCVAEPNYWAEDGGLLCECHYRFAEGEPTEEERRLASRLVCAPPG